MKFERFHARDTIALIVILCGFGLLYVGKNGWVTAILTLIIGYYFSKRVYEENGVKPKVIPPQ